MLYKVVHSCTDRCRLAGFCLPSPRVILKVLPSWFPIFSAYSPEIDNHIQENPGSSTPKPPDQVGRDVASIEELLTNEQEEQEPDTES